MSSPTLGPGPTSHVFLSQRLRLRYVDYGSAGKPLLVLVHGGRDHARNWDAVAARLCDRYHVIAPDLRGHGDSEWAIGGQYAMPDYVLDLAQLLRHVGEERVGLVGHSLGGAICLHYAGIFPNSVEKLCAIEGMGPPPEMIVDRPVEERWREWIATMQDLAARKPREYPALDDAAKRMHEANPHLTADMARHLTVHGTMRLENGAYVWKFDNYVRAWGPHRYDAASVERLWSLIDCPVLLLRGTESWASNPVTDGRARYIRKHRYVEIERAGHWVHHDRFEEFMRHLERFLDAQETGQ
jgi:pimeloyl-ACP methyl ester carboxylesterase